MVFKRLLNRLRPASARAVIVVGVDYATHRLIQASRSDRRLRVVAAIDDHPWHHRTRIQGVRVHYPAEIAALADSTGARTVLVFAGAARQLDAGLKIELERQRLRVLEADESESPAALIERVLDRG